MVAGLCPYWGMPFFLTRVVSPLPCRCAWGTLFFGAFNR